MADISRYLQDILDAVYGEEVRGSIHDAIEIINDVSEVVLTTGTAVSSASSSSTGFFDGSLYLNTNTYELWKCVGVDSWASQGILKGDQGVPGEDGNKWYRGTGISGKAANPTVYSGSGIVDANPNDFYLNPVEGAVYHCVTGGDASTATWSYDFTMTGGGGGGSVVTWTQIQGSTGATKIAEIDIDGSTQSVYAPSGGGGGSYTAGNGIDSTELANNKIQLDYGSVAQANTTKPVTGKAVDDAIPDMVPNNSYVATMTTKSTDATDDDYVSAYATANWSNCDAVEILTTVAQGADTVGTWVDGWKESGASRSGWIWDSALYGILSDDSVKIEPIFVPNSDDEVVGLYAMRIDDNVQNGVDGGAVAFKFTGAIQSASGVKVGVRLTKQRTKVKTVTPLT